MATLIDRRFDDSGKNTVNKQKFYKRIKRVLRKAAAEELLNRSIEDMKKEQKITISNSSVEEPEFTFGDDNDSSAIQPGNKRFKKGDKIKKQSRGNRGHTGNGLGNDIDSFSFVLSAEEFMNLLFEDCELPDLVKRSINETEDFVVQPKGFVNSGCPANISIQRSFNNALARKVAWESSYYEEIIEVLHRLLKHAENKDRTLCLIATERLRELYGLLANIPYMDEMDLRFKYFEKEPIPATTAVMFCIMDVSGSMDEEMKGLAKKFFILLHVFLKQNYEKVKLVFVRHTEDASEVDEETFFKSRDTGGTVISSALHLTRKIIQEKYNSENYNIYIAQASDGDNFPNDNVECHNLLVKALIPMVQYMCYIEIDTFGRIESAYTKMCMSVAENFTNFSVGSVSAAKDIYPVFKQLFGKK